jgi:hypothetical protein
VAELAGALALQDAAAEAGDRAPAAPTVDELWQLLGRAGVIMRALVDAPDRATRQRCQERAQAWLHDVGQAWVHTPVPAPPARAGRRS